MSIGCHISKNSSILDKKEFGKHKSYMIAIKKETELLNMSAFAIFCIGPLNKSKVVGLDHQGIKTYCEENNITIYTHCSYITSGIWNVSKSTRHENKSLMYLRLIKDELLQGKQLGARGVVLHVPRHPVSTIVETMEILSDCKVINSIRRNAGILPKLSLEMPASKPNEELTFETPEKLNTLVKSLVDNDKITIDFNLVIDTCHQYAGGVSYKEPNSWHEYIEALTPTARNMISLIHLNGAMGKNYSSGKDGHVTPLSRDDAIWSHLLSDEFRDFAERTSFEEINKINLYEKLSSDELKVLKNSSLYDIVKFAKKNNVAMIMEINKTEYNSAKIAMDIINGLLKDATVSGGTTRDSNLLELTELKI